MFDLDEEQRLTQKSVHDFAKKELAPLASDRDSREEFPWDALSKMGQVGLTGLRLPAEYGGAGAGLITAGVALEEVARYDHSCAIILWGTNISCRVLLHASEDLKKGYLPALAGGTCILAFAAMEADAGSEIRAITTSARLQDGSYVVSGEKSMITFAPVSRAFIVLVRTGSEHGGISCVLIEADRSGIDVQQLHGFGWRATQWGNVVFDEVAVPAGNLIGEEGQALSMLKKTVQEQRALTGIIALGTAKQALEEAVKYARVRKVYGKPLGKFEAIQFRLAEDFTAVESARLLCYQALHLIEKNAEDASVWAAMANLIGGETAFRVVNNAMDTFGGLGYSRELPLERYLRDVKAVQIANATLKIEIGQGLFGRDFAPYA
jgi:alkylation response protein AidB-like acyl-CoA dehydrogenase